MKRIKFRGIIKKGLVVLIIIFVSFTSFFAGLVYNGISQDIQNSEDEINDLLRKAEALDASFNELVDFELLEISTISNYAFDVKLLAEDVHLRLELNNSGQEQYKIGDYLSDLQRIAESVIKINLETLDTSAFYLLRTFKFDNDSYIEIQNRGYKYNITESNWDYFENEVWFTPILIQTNIGDYLDTFYQNWNSSAKTIIQQDYMNYFQNNQIYNDLSLNSGTIFVYNNAYGFYDVIEADYEEVLGFISGNKTELTSKQFKANSISILVSFTTVATILTTFVATSIENKENDLKLEKLKAVFNNLDEDNVKSSRDILSILILLFAFLLTLSGLIVLFYIVDIQLIINLLPKL